MSRRAPRKLSPEIRRLQNIAEHWQGKYAACQSAEDYVAVGVDRAKAAAMRIKRTTGSDEALKDLARLLATWAEQCEQAEAKRRVS
ncbi:hypothetical protein [Actinocorallia populi]|uniref:hypothetical protein n=1 Tax=Actinocorallia populi TaxID=2079200 RepID=UPI0013006CE9|nr:hypothetical protein [Actinocorallia populi]